MPISNFRLPIEKGPARTSTDQHGSGFVQDYAATSGMDEVGFVDKLDPMDLVDLMDRKTPLSCYLILSGFTQHAHASAGMVLVFAALRRFIGRRAKSAG